MTSHHIGESDIILGFYLTLERIESNLTYSIKPYIYHIHKITNNYKLIRLKSRILQIHFLKSFFMFGFLVNLY